MKNLPLGLCLLTILSTASCWEGATKGDGKQKKEALPPGPATPNPSPAPAPAGPSTGAPAAAPRITEFKADGLSVAKGDSIRLSWKVSGATATAKITLSAQEGQVAPVLVATVKASDSRWVAPPATTVYILDVFAAADAATAAATSSFTITVTKPKNSAFNRSDEGTVRDGTGTGTPGPAGDKTPPPADACVGAPSNSQELTPHIQLAVSPAQVYPGETVSLTWLVDIAQPTARVQLAANGQVLATTGLGTQELRPATSQDYQLSVQHCGVSASRTVSVTVNQWERKNVHNAAIVYNQGAGRTYWLGKKDGSLHKSMDMGARWSQVSASPRTGWVSNNGRKTDATPITAILEMATGCTDALFIGSEKGYFYRSTDGGRTFGNYGTGQGYLMRFYTDRDDPDNTPSAIRFILKDPSNPRRVYIGHANGLERLNDCAVTALPTRENNSFTVVAPSLFARTDVAHGAVAGSKVYVANAEGIYASADGEAWEKVSIFQEEVTSLSSDGNNLHAVTENAHWIYDGTGWVQEPVTGVEAGVFLFDRVFQLADGEVSVKKAGTLTSLTIENDRVLRMASFFDSGANPLWVVTERGLVYSLWAPAQPVTLSLILITYAYEEE